MKKTAPISYNLDFLRVTFFDEIPHFQDFFVGLSENSNYTVIHWLGVDFEIHYHYTKNKKILEFNFDKIPVICLEECLDFGLSAKITYWVKFYGAFFRFDFLQNDFLNNFSTNYTHYKNKITRVDIAIDIPFSMEQFLDKGYKTQARRFTNINLNEKNIPETLYIGRKDSSNRKYYFRIYNKLKDLNKKNKVLMYEDYYKYENVSRIELQINQLSCEEYNINIGNITDFQYLSNIFQTIAKNDNGTYLFILNEIEFPEFFKSPYSRKNNIKDLNDTEKSLNAILFHLNKIQNPLIRDSQIHILLSIHKKIEKINEKIKTVPDK